MADKKNAAIVVLCVVTILFLGLWLSSAQEANRLKGELYELEVDYEKLARVRTNLEENYSELRTDKEDLEKEYSYLEVEYFSLEIEYSSLKEDYDVLLQDVEDLTRALALEYEKKTPKITMIATGIEWRDAGDYDLQDSFPKGYDDDFLIIYEIEEHHHDLIYRVSMDIYIISGGTIYFAEHWTDEGTYPFVSDYWYHSYYYPVDIQWLSNNFYTVIVTVTDLITGESNSKSISFTITL